MQSKSYRYSFARAAKGTAFALFSTTILATGAFGQEEGADSAGSFVLDPIVVEDAPPAPAAPRTTSTAASAPAVTPRPSGAQTEADSLAAGPSGSELQPDGLNLNAPSESGSRLGLTPFETPASIQIIPGEEIRDRGQQTVHEAITQDAAGFTWLGAPGNGGGSYSVRGFDGVNSVMNLYDGTRFYVGAGTMTFPFDTWSVERIEVLRGPASVLYGEGAIGGTINVVPKKPTFESINQAEISFNDQGQKRGAFDSGGAISNKAAYRFNIAGQKTDDGWLDENGDFEDLMIAGAILYEPTSDLSFTLSHDYGYQEPLRYFGSPLLNGKVPERIRSKNYNVNDSAVSFRDNWTQFKTEWTPTENVTIRNTAYYVTSDRHWKNAESYSLQPNGNWVDRSVYIEIYHEQEQIGNRFDATLDHHLFGMKNKVLGGFDVNHIDFTHINNSPYGGSSTVNAYHFNPGRFINEAGTSKSFNSKTNQASVFFEDHLSLTDDLSVLAGLRYDSPEVERTDYRTPENSFTKRLDSLSWRVGAVWNPFQNTALYAQYSTAADPVTSLITMSASYDDFDLTTGNQVEAGVKQLFWGGRGEFTLAGYRIEKEDLLTTDPHNSAKTVQVGAQSSQGVEASLSMQLTETLRADGNLALLQAEYDDFTQSVNGRVVSYAGNQPRNVPEQVANLWLSWAFAPKWVARGGLQYVGSVYSDYANTSKRPSFTVVNAMLDYRVTEKSTLSLRGFNLFDEVYAQTGNSSMWRLGQPQTFELSYRIGF